MAPAPFPLDVLEVPGLPGRLGLGFAPGRKLPREIRSLTDDLRSLRNDHHVAHLVCLLEAHELGLLGIPELLEAAEENSLCAHHFPIPDGSVPDGPSSMQRILEPILQALTRGEGVFVHCWAGLGRTGTVATACLIARGAPFPEALAQVRRARPGAVETRAQSDFLQAFEAWHRTEHP